MTEPTPNPLLADILAFCERNDISKWDFGERALNDRPFVGQLEKGRDVKMSTAQKIQDWMAQNDQQPSKAA